MKSEPAALLMETVSSCELHKTRLSQVRLYSYNRSTYEATTDTWSMKKILVL